MNCGRCGARRYGGIEHPVWCAMSLDVRLQVVVLMHNVKAWVEATPVLGERG